MMNIVGMFGHFWKISCLINIMVEHYFKTTSNTSQGRVATIHRWGGQVYNFPESWVLCVYRKLLKSVDFHRFIHTIKMESKRIMFLRHMVVHVCIPFKGHLSAAHFILLFFHWFPSPVTSVSSSYPSWHSPMLLFLRQPNCLVISVSVVVLHLT